MKGTKDSNLFQSTILPQSRASYLMGKKQQNKIDYINTFLFWIIRHRGEIGLFLFKIISIGNIGNSY